MTKVSGDAGRARMATEPVRYLVDWRVSPKSVEVPRSTGQQAYLVATNGMPRAAPGDIVRGALRRNYPVSSRVSVSNSGGYTLIYPYRLGMEIFIYPYARKSNECCYFALHFSCFEVERGRLGEVVSLVGDCRPPPPGNPRRPITPVDNKTGRDRRRVWTARAVMGGYWFTAGSPKSGEVFPSGWMLHSFKDHQKPHNLKELNNPQYFKNNRSFSSCVRRKHVLKFLHFHSHLCGQLGVAPPPIAITNVLETR
jgi:hypothetical protein